MLSKIDLAIGGEIDRDGSDIHIVDLVPMAITRADSTHGCVAALSADGEWLRPEPVFTNILEGPDSIFSYRRFVRCHLGPSRFSDCRPEDRQLLAGPDLIPVARPLDDEEWFAWCKKHCDPGVSACFTGERSIGLIEAMPERIYLKRSTQKRLFVRMVFRDASGAIYDWIVPEIRFSRLGFTVFCDDTFLSEPGALFLQRLRAARVFLCIGLTKPNNWLPGMFRGCHPLVVGVHTFPDCSTLFSGIAASPPDDFGVGYE
jgi:hypothetical protein